MVIPNKLFFCSSCTRYITFCACCKKKKNLNKLYDSKFKYQSKRKKTIVHLISYISQDSQGLEGWMEWVVILNRPFSRSLIENTTEFGNPLHTTASHRVRQQVAYCNIFHRSRHRNSPRFRRTTRWSWRIFSANRKPFRRFCISAHRIPFRQYRRNSQRPRRKWLTSCTYSPISTCNRTTLRPYRLRSPPTRRNDGSPTPLGLS